MASPRAAEPAPELPGLTLQAPAVGRGSGEIWRAVDESGVPVLVRILRLRGDPAFEEVARWRAGSLVAAGSGLSGVDPVLAVREFDDGVGLVRADDASLRPRWRGSASRQPEPLARLTADGCRLGEALAGLHDRGTTHGRLTRADVLVDAAGGIRLVGYGVAGVLGAAATPHADVAALVRVLLRQLPAGDPKREPLSRELSAVLEADGTARELAAVCAGFAPAPAVRGVEARTGRRRRVIPGRPGRGGQPDPAAVRRLSALTMSTVPPATATTPPIAVPGPAGPAPAERARAPRPGWRGVAIMAVLVAGAATVGWRTARPARSGGHLSAAVACPASLPGVADLTRLQAARAQIFSRLPDDPVGALAAVDLPGGPAAAGDLARLRALQARGARATGLRTRVEQLRLAGCAAGRVQLTVIDSVGAYSFVDAAGNVLARSPGHPRQEHLITLAGSPGRWRFQEVAAPPA